jgi:hypothetical protein
VIPNEGLPPGAKCLVADSAYSRTIEELKAILYLPTKLPENGDNPSVRIFFSFWSNVRLICAQNDDLKATHKVQSYRGLIERMFARLKKWEVLFGALVESIDTKEMELDCAMALQNLIELFRLKLQDSIPARAPFSANAHIITRNLDPILKIPPVVALDSAKMPPHVVAFHGAMSTMYPTIRKKALGLPGAVIFPPRLLKRGENLFKSGNVVQFMVQDEGLGVWRIRFSVAASMKFPVYKCYAILNAEHGVQKSFCECKNG